MFKYFQRSMVVLITVLTCTSAVAQESAEPSVKELYELIKAQQAQLELQQQRIEQLTKVLSNNENQLVEVSEQAEFVATAVADQVDDLSEQTGNTSFRWFDRVRVGGYGEVLYNSGTSSSSFS